MWMMGIANSYTMEASFAGSTLGNRADTHFTTHDYEQMGRSFCQTLLDFYDEDPKKVFNFFTWKFPAIYVVNIDIWILGAPKD